VDDGIFGRVVEATKFQSHYSVNNMLHYYVKEGMCTSGFVCNGASVVTKSFVSGRSLGSYCKHLEARLTTTVASSVENFPSKCESIKSILFFPCIISSACKQNKITPYGTNQKS